MCHTPDIQLSLRYCNTDGVFWLVLQPPNSVFESDHLKKTDFFTATIR